MTEWKKIEEVIHIGGDDSGFIAVSKIPDLTVNMNKKPKGILFNTEMVQAILSGRKTATRRPIKPTDKNADRITVLFNYRNEIIGAANTKDGAPISDIKPPYQKFDTLYVRETWRPYKDGYLYKASCNDDWDGLWKPSIHMPKEAARIWLKVTNVRVERLQDMKTEDFQKEGITVGDIPGWWNIIEQKFRKLWNSTIPKQDLDKYGWDANPYVFVVSFERIEKGDI